MKLLNTTLICSAVGIALLATPAFAHRAHHRYHWTRHYAFAHRAPHYRYYRAWAQPEPYPWPYPGTNFGASGSAYAVPENESGGR
jgi:hypothetical protein